RTLAADRGDDITLETDLGHGTPPPAPRQPTPRPLLRDARRCAAGPRRRPPGPRPPRGPPAGATAGPAPRRPPPARPPRRVCPATAEAGSAALRGRPPAPSSTSNPPRGRHDGGAGRGVLRDEVVGPRRGGDRHRNPHGGATAHGGGDAQARAGQPGGQREC